jgi:hypothetical protein
MGTHPGCGDTDVTLLVLERTFDPPIDRDSFLELARSGSWCFEQYRVDWLGSMLNIDGRSMVCQFESGDAESIRKALKTLDADVSVLWPATVHAVQNPSEANVVVERSFDQPCDLDALQAQEDSKQWCLDTHQVKFVSTLLATDKKRMLCLYSAPDADAVCTAQRKAEMPVDRVWSFRRIGPGDALA